MSPRLARCWHTNKLLPQRLSRLPSLSNLCFFTSLHSTRFLSLPCIVKNLRIYKYFHTLRTDESAKEITLCGTLLTPRNFVTAMTLFWNLSAEPIYLVAAPEPASWNELFYQKPVNTLFFVLSSLCTPKDPWGLHRSSF